MTLPLTDFDIIRQLLISTTGFEIGYYKPAYIKRLLTTIMVKAGAKNFQEYVRILRRNPREVEAFKNRITIHISEFFRDKPAFDLLRDKIIPMLLAGNRKLDLWSAGCSTGEEAYSLAMILEEKRTKSKAFDYSIWATDIDEAALGQAKLGLYAKSALKNVSPIQLQACFTKTNQGFLINPASRVRIIFERLDLLQTIPPRKFHLIVCRNVAIYFTEKYKEKVYSNISKTLSPGGILFLGGSERLIQPAKFALEKLDPGFYLKK